MQHKTILFSIVISYNPLLKKKLKKYFREKTIVENILSIKLFLPDSYDRCDFLTEFPEKPGHRVRPITS